MNKILVLQFALMAVIFASCDDNSVTDENPRTGLPIISSYISIEYIENELDNGNLIGYIELLRIDDKGLQVYGDNNLYNITEIRESVYLSEYAEGTFWDQNLDLISLGPNIMINARPINEYQTGLYDDQGEMDIYPNAQNKFSIDSNSAIDFLIDSAYVGDVIEIMGVGVGDTIDISDGYTFNWTGNPNNLNNKVRIELEAAYYPTDYQITDSSFIGLSNLIIDNNNSFKIGGQADSTEDSDLPAPVLKNLVKDMYYHFEVTGFEPHYIPTSSGKDILVVVVSVSKRTVFIKD